MVAKESREGEKPSKEKKHGQSSKKGKKKKQVVKAEEAPKVVTLDFNGHQFTGILCTDSLGKRSFDGPDSSYTWTDGLRYEGPFKESEITGTGKFLWPDGSTYEGDLRKGKRHGHGVFLAADGVTKYEGEWSEGKRHGVGQLSYDANKETYYKGQWANGCKHGEGFQIWPSKNTYEGQWKEGRMSGHGTMTWYDGGQLERYTGQWDNDVPQGQGKHVWHAPDMTRHDVAGVREMPSQQTNNCYQGSWALGLRSGYGTFRFASGALYEGEWSNNIKQGDGRYTYEDGSVYSGQFSGDNMADPSVSRYNNSATNAALNIGGEDNPVRRSIDIADLEGFCIPTDRELTDPTARSGFSAPSEVFREVYNLLLRNMGDLKKIYGMLRKVLQKPGEDPWVVSMYQLWILAREAGLLAPDCSISCLDRRILCGPRFQMETCHTDLEDVRPLTPRQTPETGPTVKDTNDPDTKGSNKNEALRGSVTGVFAEEMEEESEDEENDEEGVEMDSVQGDEEETSRQISPTAGSRGPSRSGSRAGSRRGSAMSLRGVGTALRGLGTSHTSTSAIGAPDVNLMVTPFWRKNDTTDEIEPRWNLIDIHLPDTRLMFRHFLEAIVRVSQACYPHEQGLDSMVKSLLQERILPLLAQPFSTSSQSTFAFVADEKISKVFESCSSRLWQLFKTHAEGEGEYARQKIWSADPEPSIRLLRRHFCGVHRRVHVRARMDVSIRVKDVFHVLRQAGLLSTVDASLMNSDPTGTVFPDRVVRPVTTETNGSAGTEPLEELSALKSLEIPGTEQAAGATSMSNRVDSSSAEPASVMSTSGHDFGGGILGDAFHHPGVSPSATPDQGDEAVTDEDPAEEFLKCDFRVHFHRVLEIITELLQPEVSARIRWSLHREAPLEHVALLDFLETELTFAEFQRLLLRLAETFSGQTKHAASIRSHECLEMFLQQVFLPSLDTPYVPPPSAVPEADPASEKVQQAEEGAEETEAVDPSEEAAEKAAEGEAAEEGVDASAEVPPEEGSAEPFEFWYGFCDLDELELPAVVTPRIWPEGFVEEVLAW
eukprot:TRINITY_DN105393_c0_g1_i1.p1 TRINITY_DN105393_c0_g1~~TRINITY_DN105393_c0_g1_i1.p1  ORF type:complete len:1054 (+),score=208.09 TRINITY_DN105393_c0_g1_i1:48-3209(+)